MSRTQSPADERTPLLTQRRDEDALPAPDGPVDEATGFDKPTVSIAAVMTPLILGIFLVAMDVTIVTSTYASIGSQFNQLQNTSWIATAYMLSMTTFQPLYGKLSDIFGRKACLLVAYTIFATGCLFCGLARNMTELVVARALAGVGGGGMSTVGSIIMSDVATLRQRGTLQGFANIAFASGQAVGAPLGGLLVDRFSWRWAFLLQVPLMLLAILIVSIFLRLPSPPSSDLDFRAKLARIDFAGSGALIVSIFTLLVGLDRGGNVAWSDRLTIGALACAGVFFALFALVELRWAREPFAPKRIVANQTLLASYLCNMFGSAAAVSTFFLASLYLQAVQHASASTVGLMLIPAIFGGVAGSLGAGLVMQATGKYYVLTIVMFAVMLSGSLAVALVTGVVPYSVTGLIYGTTATQLGYGSGLTSTLIALVANAGPEDQAIATASSYLFRSLGTVVGVSVGTTLTQDVLRSSLRKRLTGEDVDEIVRRVRESLAYIDELEPRMRQQVVSAYQDGLQAAFWLIAALSTVTVVCAVFIREKPLTR
ncbi:MFS general substrate transporter [Epithele typhae]|uniref:MFS general substrate transporter n=1 Tax=Epithele typhae TaxID=378194 RepID=UPI002007EF41|nr:MFS general substrate transporter [Epithele typhae]KAH9934029.1 MFS general substrate transporter [Epithele typhae]